MVGSLGNLYHSVEHMDGTYMRAGFDKDALLKPTLPCNTSCQSTFLMESSQSSSAKKYYGCSPGSCRNRGGFGGSSSYVYVTDGTGVLCPACGRPMTAELTYVPPKQEEVTGGDGGGYVKEVATYMVMDDLSVEPMSTISCITLLNKFHVKDVGSLEERTVELNMDEGLRLLKASFHSNTVLTDVFLRRTAP
uniref:GTPase obg n=1 Tax=Anthurium amnicola TaxID=1678845 RepID=A0A1D1ZEG8_9ARAE